MSDEPLIETVTISSGESELLAQVYSSETASVVKHGVLILHGFPSKDLEAELVTSGLDALALRAVSQIDCKTMVLGMSGCGGSGGNFSLSGWVKDASSAVSYLCEEYGITHNWIVGFGTGGAVGLVAAADSESVAGVATLGSPADFDDWHADPNGLLEFAKQIGAITEKGFPDDIESWQAELSEVRAVAAASKFSSKSLMVIHGSEDTVVPHFDARIIADEHGSADLRFINGGAHQLKHDPRAIAVLLGWLSLIHI